MSQNVPHSRSVSSCSCEDRSQQLPTLSNIHPGGEQPKVTLFVFPPSLSCDPRLSMIQEMQVHPICNTAVHKTWPRLPTSLPGPLEVSSQVLISPRMVLLQPPEPAPQQQDRIFPHGMFPYLCPVGEGGIHHGFTLLI